MLDPRLRACSAPRSFGCTADKLSVSIEELLSAFPEVPVPSFEAPGDPILSPDLSSLEGRKWTEITPGELLEVFDLEGVTPIASAYFLPALMRSVLASNDIDALSSIVDQITYREKETSPSGWWTTCGTSGQLGKAWLDKFVGCLSNDQKQFIAKFLVTAKGVWPEADAAESVFPEASRITHKPVEYALEMYWSRFL